LIEFIIVFTDMDLSVFLNFNKIKSITTDVSVIGKALAHSKLLEVSQEGEKMG